MVRAGWRTPEGRRTGAIDKVTKFDREASRFQSQPCLRVGTFMVVVAVMVAALAAITAGQCHRAARRVRQGAGRAHARASTGPAARLASRRICARPGSPSTRPTCGFRTEKISPAIRFRLRRDTPPIAEAHAQTAVPRRRRTRPRRTSATRGRGGQQDGRNLTAARAELAEDPARRGAPDATGRRRAHGVVRLRAEGRSVRRKAGASRRRRPRRPTRADEATTPSRGCPPAGRARHGDDPPGGSCSVPTGRPAARGARTPR